MTDTVYINLENADCQLQNANTFVINELEEALSYTDQNAEYASTKAKNTIMLFSKLLKRETDANIIKAYKANIRKAQYLFDANEKNKKISLLKDNRFASGLLPKVLDRLDELGIYWELLDKRVKPKQLKELKKIEEFPPLRHYQQTALDKIVQYERGIIVAPTGSGKSLIFSSICEKFLCNTLIITPNTEIAENAYNTLVTYFGDKIVSLLNSKSDKITRINVCNIQSLVNIDEKLFKNLGCCIIDEFHRSAASSYHEINNKQLKNCYYRIGLTATNFRNGGDGLALEAILSNVLFEYSIKDAFKEKVLVPPKFIWINNKIKASGKYQAQYKKGIVENEDRNCKIAEICEEYQEDRHIIVLVKQLTHAYALQELLPQATIITGKESKEDRKQILNDYRNGKIRILIGTSVIGEGVDLPIADTLIMAAGGKARSQVMQNVGRVLRQFPNKSEAFIVDFADKGAKYLEKHAKERAAIYNEVYGQNT